MPATFLLLGPLEAVDEGEKLSLGTGRQRAVLGYLLVHPNDVVSSGRLIEELWSGQPPPSAQKALQGYVSQLRRVLPAGTIMTRGSGYALVASETDAAEFERLVRLAAEQEPAEASATLRRALALWRGRPLEGFEYEAWAQVEIGRLEELRLGAIEDRIEADLELGLHAQLVPELEALVAEHPLRERLRGQFMVALYRSGRQADALEVYRRGRRTLRDQLGLEPSPFLEELEKQILTHDRTLATPARRLLPRGTVTFLFTDIEGSTRLLKELGDRYVGVLAEHQRILRDAAERHEGREVDTQGDSFFFAFPRAKLAVAAAVGAQRALAEHDWPTGVRLRVRMGMHTGEPVVGEERYAGIGVHRAARIAAVGHGGQVLLSNTTRELVEDEAEGVRVRELGSYRLKDIDRPERLFQLEIKGLPSEFPPLKAERAVEPQTVRRRSILVTALAGVIAAAVAIPLFALGSGGAANSPKPFVRATVGGDSVGVFNLQKSRLVAQVPVRKRPSAVATGLGAVWVANVDDDSVSRIDPRTNAVEQTIAVGNAPSGIAVGGGFVWVANSLGGSVWQIDPRTNSVVKKIAIGGNPSGVTYGDAAVWVSDASDRVVRTIDPRTDSLGAAIRVDAGASAVAVGLGSVWVASQSSASISKLDPQSGNSQPINVGNGPTAIAVGAGSVWVTNSLDGTVSRVDPASNRQLAVIPVGAGPSAVVVTPDGRTVWVANAAAGTVSRVDVTQNRAVQTIATGDHPDGVATSGSALYVAVRAAGANHRGGTLRVLEPGVLESQTKPDLLDPAITYYAATWQLLMNTNDGLVGFQRVGGISGTLLVPDLATSLPVPSNHGRTYTFQLRPGIHYSTGALVRPADFRRAIERSLTNQNPDGTGPGAGYYSGIVGAALCVKSPERCDLSKGIVTGANTISFHLEAPDPDFLYKLAMPTAYAEPADTQVSPQLPLPATGPYQIGAFRWLTPKTHFVITLVRNPRFHQWSAAAQPQGFPDRIVADFAAHSEGSQVASVERGSSDLTSISGEVPAALRTQLRIRYSAQLHNNPTLGTLDLYLNTRLPPFNDVRVRQAVSYAIDRNLLARLAGGRDFNEPTCQVLPPALAGYHRYCPYTIRPTLGGRYAGPDLAKARRLVAASGTKGQTVTLNFGKPYLEHSPFPRYWASVLRQLGYKVRTRGVSPTTFANSYDSRLKWQVKDSGWIADYPSASNFITGNLTCASYVPASPSRNGNFSEFCGRAIDAEITRAQSLGPTDPQAAAAAWAKVDHHIVDLAPWVPYLVPHTIEFVSSRVGNYVYSLWVGSALLDQLWVR